MKALQMIIKDGLGDTCRNFRNKPIFVFVISSIHFR